MDPDYVQIDLERMATNLRMEEALLGLLDLLDSIPVVVFKGPLLTRLIYGDLRQRASADNDLWVAEPHVQVALHRLLAHGYRPTPGLDAQRALRRVGQVALFAKDARQPSVDLHAEPYSRRFFSVDYARVAQHVRPTILHGRQVMTFDEPLAFTHLVAHFLQHHFELSMLADIACAWERWSVLPGFRQSVLALSRVTCTVPALLFILRLMAMSGGAAAGHDKLEQARAWQGSLTMWEGVRVRYVLGRFWSRGSTVKAPPLGVERKFLALFLVAPHRLASEMTDAILLDQDDLVSRYGPGRRDKLLWRHLWTKLSE